MENNKTIFETSAETILREFRQWGDEELAGRYQLQLDEALTALNQLHQQEILKEKISYKLDELSLVPEHPHANLNEYKELRRAALRRIRTNLNNTKSSN